MFHHHMGHSTSAAEEVKAAARMAHEEAEVASMRSPGWDEGGAVQAGMWRASAPSSSSSEAWGGSIARSAA